MLKEIYLDSLKQNMIILHDFVSKMTDEETGKRIKDYWTIYEHVSHLVTSQKILLARMKQFVEEEQPVMRPYNPGTEPGTASADKPVKELLDEYSEVRNQQIALIQKTSDKIWQKEGSHPEYRKYNFDILVRHAILHDSFHMWRMEELWIEKEDSIKEFN